jgi:ribonuclease HII
MESRLVAAGATSVIGCDEVGRGPLAGPVVVGLAVWYPRMLSWPDGLLDSKAIPEKRRGVIAEAVRECFRDHALGEASAVEVDEWGINQALGVAVVRGLVALASKGVTIGSSVLLLDGTVDYVTRYLPHPLRVVTKAKADRDCVSVAAASVIAKVHRDNYMIELATRYPDYGFERHKGYGSQSHRDALVNHGLTAEHRASWIRL